MADDSGDTGEGEIKEKLIRSKEKWAEEGRLLTGEEAEPERDRLPPGQRETKDWPVLDLGIQPDISRAEWKLTVDGLVKNSLEWDWGNFMAQPTFTDVSDIHCVTAWSRYDNKWEGVSTRHLLDIVQPEEKACHVVLHSYDGYTTNVTLEHFAAADALLAHSWEGEPLTRQHGAPVRVIIPRYYLWKSAKWVNRIEFCGEDHPGFWEVRGYHNQGDPWKEERYGRR